MPHKGMCFHSLVETLLLHDWRAIHLGVLATMRSLCFHLLTALHIFLCVERPVFHVTHLESTVRIYVKE